MVESLDGLFIRSEALVSDYLNAFQGLKDNPSSAHIGIKRMGELDTKPFYEAIKQKYKSEADAEERASELCSLWDEYLKDPEWHPTKVIINNGKPEVCNLPYIHFLLCFLSLLSYA